MGHIAGSQGICVAHEKIIKAILNTQDPKIVTELKGFLVLARYYRHVFWDFSDLSGWLDAAISKNRKFRFMDDGRLAFSDLKSKDRVAPVLSFPKFEAPFKVELDSSSVVVGALLTKNEEDWKSDSVQFANRTCSASKKRYSECEKIALGVVFALNKFKIYLLGAEPFQLVIDHQALRYAFKKTYVHGHLVFWLDVFAEYDFVIVYQPEAVNTAADYLSRHSQFEKGTERATKVLNAQASAIFRVLDP